MVVCVCCATYVRFCCTLSSVLLLLLVVVVVVVLCAVSYTHLTLPTMAVV